MDKNKLIEMIEDAFGISYIGFLEEVDSPSEYIGSRFIPLKSEYDYDWVYHIFDNTVAMAKLMARGDAEAPIVGGPAVKKVAGSVAPFGQKFEVAKNVLNKIFNPRNDSELKSNLRRILDESARNIRAAQSRREWMIWQVLARGAINFTDEDNNEELNVDFGVPGEHKIDSTALEGDAWNGDSPRPLSDLIMLCERYYDTNDEMPSTIIMRRKQLRQLTSSGEVASEFSENATRISLSVVNDYLTELGYPTVETYDVFVRNLDNRGRPTVLEYLIPEGRVVLAKASEGSQEIKDTGRLVMGPVAENSFQPGIFTTIYEESDPLKYWHFMKTEMWPAVHNPEHILFADVEA